MLILPLHHPLSRATFPLVTTVLILVNVLVFFGWQSGDEAAMARTQQHYLQSDLGRYEVPAYERYLLGKRRMDLLEQFKQVPASAQPGYVATHTLTDIAFIAALRSGELFDDEADWNAWKVARPAYDAQIDQVFTLRHLLRSSEIDPWRMVSSAFLHGGIVHLLGNMLFLLALGLLVEGAIGSGRFLGVYLLGAVGASAASLMWRWGEAGAGLGASGAVAGLMGAFCVVWGRQPVRFFYWVGVVFDYVRAPAIWLLPLWLGWEVWNLIVNDHLEIGFDAHAGGIVSGAIMGAVLVATGQVRHDFIRDAGAQARTDGRWQRAQLHLCRMQLAEADRLLEELALEQPARFDVRLALYRVARNGQRSGAMAGRGARLLAIDTLDSEEVREQIAVLAELDAAALAPKPSDRLALARRWLDAAQLDAAEAALLPGSGNDPSEQARLWFRLALGWRDQRADDAHQRVLRLLTERYPQQPEADKARFLLAELIRQEEIGPAVTVLR